MEAAGGDASETCPACGVELATDEKSCPVCGSGVAGGPAAALVQDPVPQSAPSAVSVAAQKRFGTARKWLLAISIITLVSGFIFYGIQKSEVEKQIRDAQAQIAGMDPAVLDETMKRESGMTFQEAIDHDRGMVNMLLTLNIGLAVIYFGLWIYAKRNAYTAALIALLLFVTVIVVGAVMEPRSIHQGIVMKILFIAALAKAVKAGGEERKLLGAM